MRPMTKYAAGFVVAALTASVLGGCLRERVEQASSGAGSNGGYDGGY